jgi:hypothetical protein
MKIPLWLSSSWKVEAPEFPEGADTVEELAERVIANIDAITGDKMSVKERKEKITPHLLQALALDLMFASFPEGTEPAPVSLPDGTVLAPGVERLMVLALGLPADHEAGDWERKFLQRRGGGADREAFDHAWLIDHSYFLKHGARMPDKELARWLQAEGRDTTSTTIREWRKKGWLPQ